MESIPLAEMEASPAAKFTNLDDKYAGTIVAIKHQQQTDPADGKPKFFASGDPMMLYVITIQPDGGDAVALWAANGKFVPATGSGQAMLAAIATAVRKAGAQSVEIGGRLAVAHTGMGEAKPGMNAPRLYTAQYQPPTSAPETTSVAVDDLFSKS